MYVKKYFINIIYQSYYQLKGIGLAGLVPFVWVFILTPLSNIGVYLRYHDMNILYDSVLKECQLYLPFATIWYTIFQLYHYVEQPGREVLYVNQKVKLGQLLIVHMASVLCTVPLFIVYSSLFSDMWWLFAKLVLIALLYFSFLYAVCFLTERIVFGAIGVLGYLIYNVVQDTLGKVGLSYYRPTIAIGELYFIEMIPIIIGIIVFIIVGLIGNWSLVRKRQLEE